MQGLLVTLLQPNFEHVHLTLVPLCGEPCTSFRPVRPPEISMANGSQKLRESLSHCVSRGGENPHVRKFSVACKDCSLQAEAPSYMAELPTGHLNLDLATSCPFPSILTEFLLVFLKKQHKTPSFTFKKKKQCVSVYIAVSWIFWKGKGSLQLPSRMGSLKKSFYSFVSLLSVLSK